MLPRRRAFFNACCEAPTTEPIVACEAPVGLGKTTAVTAHALIRAREYCLRRLVVVAPYTNILKQTAATLRRALTLPGEDPEAVVVEHHHRADFHSREDRDLAALWRVPVVLTTAVSFFEALAACHPSALRKLHALPGSVVILDEAHAVLPVALWPQNWGWLRELSQVWGCHFALSSGSLVRFWEDAGIVEKPEKLPKRSALGLETASQCHRARHWPAMRARA